MSPEQHLSFSHTLRRSTNARHLFSPRDIAPLKEWIGGHIRKGTREKLELCLADNVTPSEAAYVLDGLMPEEWSASLPSTGDRRHLVIDCYPPHLREGWDAKAMLNPVQFARNLYTFGMKYGDKKYMLGRVRPADWDRLTYKSTRRMREDPQDTPNSILLGVAGEFWLERLVTMLGQTARAAGGGSFKVLQRPPSNNTFFGCTLKPDYELEFPFGEFNVLLQNNAADSFDKRTEAEFDIVCRVMTATRRMIYVIDGTMRSETTPQKVPKVSPLQEAVTFDENLTGFNNIQLHLVRYDQPSGINAEGNTRLSISRRATALTVFGMLWRCWKQKSWSYERFLTERDDGWVRKREEPSVAVAD